MDDPLVRLLVVASAAAVVACWAWWRRRVPLGGPSRVIPATGLSPGTYLFTSATCAECVGARDKIGRLPHTEFAWEDRPELFDRLGITDVPSVLVVLEDGTGTWRRGVPGERSSKRNP